MFVTEDDREITMTRPEYDAMIERHPAFMATTYLNLPRSWKLYGVTAYQCAGSGIATRLNAIRKGEFDESRTG